MMVLVVNTGLPPGAAMALSDRPVHTIPQGS
jgi:hypothetical protein